MSDELRLLAELRAQQKRTEIRLQHALRALEIARKQGALTQIAKEEMERAQAPQDNLWCEVEKVHEAVAACALAEICADRAGKELALIKGVHEKTCACLDYTLKSEAAALQGKRFAEDLAKSRLISMEEQKVAHTIAMSQCARAERERCAKTAEEWTPPIARSARQLALVHSARLIATKIRDGR